jgi:hypothetical protein
MIVVLTVLLLLMLVGRTRYEMERASDTAAPHSQTCRSHIVKGGDHSRLYCPDG